MKIKVTKTNIRRGDRRSTNSCPIARAVKRTFGLDEVCVNVDSIQFVVSTNLNPTSKKIPLPKEVQDFINVFDSGNTPKNELEPFEFEL